MRTYAGSEFFLIMGIVVAFSHDRVLADVIPVDLRSDGLGAPLAVSPKPRLSWRLESAKRGQAHSASRVLVATKPEILDENRGDIWDSGKMAVKREPYVTYTGPPLVSGGRYHWKIMCWDAADSPSAWSKAAVMEVAPASPADWQGATWIDDGIPNPTQDEDFYKPDPAPLFRREFNLTKPVVRARLHLAGLGFCLPSLNGKRLQDQVLDPPWTAFDQRILFRSHDVTGQLAEGDNCLGLAMGNGWYNPLPLRMWGHRNIRGSLVTGRPRVIAMLVVEHPDGSNTIVTTGPEWKSHAGPTIRNSIFLGEERNSKFDLPGWDRAGFDAAAWKAARVVDAPLEPLEPLLTMPPVRAAGTIPAVAIISPAPSTYIVDFGKNFTGVPEVDLNLPAGSRINLRYGEILNDDGTLNPMTSVCGQIKGTRKDPNGAEVLIGGPGAPPIAWQQDTYLVRGNGPETYRPDFTFHGFRYMEITGLLEKPNVTAFRGIPLHSDLPDAGSFSCSNAQLNRIQEITRRTFLNNVVSVQSDCPHRERFAYGGDIVATSEAFLMNFDMAGFYAKTARDWADSARPDGNFTDTAPFVGIQYCGVGWSMVHPLLLEQLHTHYGDRQLVEEQFPAAARWFDGEASRRENGLVTKGLGDHEALKKIAGPVMLTPMFIDTARRMARLARIIGREGDAARFEKIAGESSIAWAKAFLDPATGKVGGASQSEQTFALGFGAAADDSQKAVFDHLVNDLTAPSDGPVLTTGIYGTRILLEELTQRGRHDLAYALADKKTFPSWGWMLENDATTLWETWKESDNTFSHNHPMFGSISAWFFRWLGGIQPAADAVGFDRILIRPQMVEGLEWVKCSHNSIRGPIVSNWSVNDDGAEFDIVIPPDATAMIELPMDKGDTLMESGRPIADASGIKMVQADGIVHRLHAGSGRFRIVVRKAQ
jgi:alpha-L-rhamnosidase